jgi:cytochrome b6-f complex iron-sulfur subunit
MNRRDFIRRSCITCAGMTGMAVLLEACTTGKYVNDFTQTGTKITVKKTVFTVVKKEKTIEQKFVLLKPESLQFPIALYKISATEYKAVLLQCTHQGCEVSPYETTIVCPCHGAEFNTKGEVKQGPAETNLKTFPLTHDDETIYIQI